MITLAPLSPGLYSLHRLDEALPEATVADLQRSANRGAVSATEAVRRALAVLAVLTGEVAGGNRPVIVGRRWFQRSRVRGLDLEAMAREIATSCGGTPSRRVAVWLADDTHQVLLRLERHYRLGRGQTVALAIELLCDIEVAVAGGKQLGSVEPGHGETGRIRELVFVDVVPGDARRIRALVRGVIARCRAVVGIR
ncbi:hypothetical protein GCM10029976_066610 [Kribbella albertanoniae]|uniref:Uncharacterized protein n=1 Tax=Kribbella albertanoniae TaxID=1266829 RepID=A0A4R4QJA5_9ACTN|nr:hypothetical protein [Kribbella albertanoniae]TDC35777.1 hypothetical protein E1261_00160 [Kribbella albertanoniae]